MLRHDPWVVLGLPPQASLAQARAARRRLAKRLHPDLHAGRSQAERAELSARMTLVNRALAEIETMGRTGSVVPAGESAEAPPGPPATQRAHATGPADPDTFSVEFLPVEAFEMLFLAAYGLGDILVGDEPYLLEVYLPEPSPCFCRLTLVPEAGGSLVTVEVSPGGEALDAPEPATVIEILVAELNALVTG